MYNFRIFEHRYGSKKFAVSAFGDCNNVDAPIAAVCEHLRIAFLSMCYMLRNLLKLRSSLLTTEDRASGRK